MHTESGIAHVGVRVNPSTYTYPRELPLGPQSHSLCVCARVCIQTVCESLFNPQVCNCSVALALAAVEQSLAEPSSPASEIAAQLRQARAASDSAKAAEAAEAAAAAARAAAAAAERAAAVATPIYKLAKEPLFATPNISLAAAAAAAARSRRGDPSCSPRKSLEFGLPLNPEVAPISVAAGIVLSLYVYTYIYTYISVYTYIYIYIYICIYICISINT